ncbi:MAG: uroporphyrinogen decarboxylase family protein [Gemmatimonadota bacterium]
MNGRERTLRAIRFQEPDRAPILGGMLCHGAFIEEASGIRPWWRDEVECMRRVYRNLGVDVIGCSTLPSRPEEASDEHGGSFAWKGEGPTPFRTAEDVLDFVRQQPPAAAQARQFDPARAYEDIRSTYAAGLVEAGDDRLFLPWGLHKSVSFHSRLTRFGFDNFLLALGQYEEEMERLFAADGVVGRLWNQVLVKVFEDEGWPKVMWHGQDICGNSGPMTSPALLHRIFMPHLKHAYEPLVEAGFRIVWHSDGNIRPIREDLLDAGVNGFQGMQELMDNPEWNNPLEELTEMTDRQGNPLLIFGSISCRRTLPYGSPDDVRAAAQRVLDLSRKRGGGHIILTDNTVGPEVPLENMYALYEYVTGVRAERHRG